MDDRLTMEEYVKNIDMYDKKYEKYMEAIKKTDEMKKESESKNGKK